MADEFAQHLEKNAIAAVTSLTICVEAKTYL
jgi:hypothetical protein